MKKITILTGAGISKESGIETFRDSDGLWETFKISEVCTTDAWKKNREEVLNFYNARRKDLEGKVPNDGHKELVKLENEYEVTVVTQNVDNLHELAGSSDVIHLHGELTKVRSTVYPKDVKDIGYGEINIGDKCERGSQLRPHIVFFGDPVPNMEKAGNSVFNCDILIVVGTSLNVYPAAGLVHEAISHGKEIHLIDPKPPVMTRKKDEAINVITEPATVGCKKLVNTLINQAVTNNLKGKELFPEKMEAGKKFFSSLDENKNKDQKN